MPVTGISRLGILRTAVALGALLSLLSLLLPNECITRLGFTGPGKALAAELAPGTVDNSTSSAALLASTQRKLFYAADRFWVFYSDGGELVYKSSSDGLSWSERSQSLGASSDGNGISVHFDGTYAHYARTTSTNGQSLYYRRGTPGGDGMIAWSEAEQIAVAGENGVRYLHPSVSTDSSGHALISYHREKQNGKAGEGPCVTMSGNSDGTWGTTPAGFPYELTSNSESEWYTTVHGLTSNKIAVTFADHTEIPMVYVSTYDGFSWNPTANTASTAHFGSDYSVLVEGDDLHIALLDEGTFEIRYCRYSYATNAVGPEFTLRSPESLSSAPALAATSNGALYCFWIKSPADRHIYYSRMIYGAWDSTCTNWLTETDLTASGGVSAAYNQGSSLYIGLAWETGLASPYQIRFGAIQTVFPPNRPPQKPANVSPANWRTHRSLTPTLESSGFVDPDGSGHAASQWQVRAASGAYSAPVFDSQRDTVNLLRITVPAGDLTYSTVYYWHVRYQDDEGEWSEWSEETGFATTAETPAPAPASQEQGSGGLPFWVAIGLEAAIALLATLTIGGVAYYTFMSLTARSGAPPPTSGPTSPDTGSEEPEPRDE